MDIDVLPIISVFIICLSAIVLIISSDWRLTISALGVMYVGVFVSTTYSLPLAMSVVKLVSGWIAAAVLGLSYSVRFPSDKSMSGYLPSELLFRISASGLFCLVAYSLTTEIIRYIPNWTFGQLFGSLVLIGTGILHIGFSFNHVGTVIGLLTFMAGFEILYCALETSLFAIGFLAVISMGISLVGAYLHFAQHLEATD